MQCFHVLTSLGQRCRYISDQKGPGLGKSSGLGLNVISDVLAVRSLYLLRVATLLFLHRCCVKPLCALNLALLPN